MLHPDSQKLLLTLLMSPDPDEWTAGAVCESSGANILAIARLSPEDIEIVLAKVRARINASVEEAQEDIRE